MEQNYTLFPVVLGQPIDSIPFTVILEELKKIITRRFNGETHLLFIMESGESWSLYPKQLQGANNSTATFILHRIKEAMMHIKKNLSIEEQVLEEKKIGNSTHWSWKSIVSDHDHH